VTVPPKDKEATRFAIPDVADEVVGLFVPPVWSSWETPSRISHDTPLCLCEGCRARRSLTTSS
jgi:hypothetical protein